MAKDDDRPLTLLGQMHAYSVRINEAMMDRVHGLLRMQTHARAQNGHAHGVFLGGRSRPFGGGCASH
jgi:hypothetical protein